jgi:Ca2+-binding EF-hand superfamily protein
MFKKMGKTWKDFIEALKKAADKDDQSQINFSTFCDIVEKFGYKLPKSEKDELLESFPG